MHPAIKAITWAPEHPHVCRIEFPNGMGYTPCSQAYRDKYDALQAILSNNDIAEHRLSMDSLTPENYDKYNHLQNDLANLQCDGHTGKSVRF